MDARVLGVVGGMGGLASAAFLDTLYRRFAALPEQTQPVVWLRSNPRLPDRTRALLGAEDDVADRPGTRRAAAEALTAGIEAELEALRAAGAHRLLVCCVTAHAVLPWLPAALQAQTISLIDALFAAPTLATRRRLVLCTEGTRRLRLLESHPGFAAHAEHLVWPDVADQAQVHALIYALKAGTPPAQVVPALAALARRLGATGLVAACTELHLLGDRPGGLPDGLDCVDPLVEVAHRLEDLLA